MLMGLFMAVFLSGFMLLVASYGEAIAHRERRQDMADSAAISAAVLYAQTMNRVASYNRVLRANLEAAVILELVLGRCRESDARCDEEDVGRYEADHARAIGRIRAAASAIEGFERDTPGRMREAVRDANGSSTARGGAFAARANEYPTIPIESVRDDELIARARAYFNEHKEDLVGNTGLFLVPIEGFPLELISSDFGPRIHPVTGLMSFHYGIDMGAPEGTPILAAREGRIVYIGYNDVAGNHIEIDHGDGYLTRYLHMRASGPFAPGMRVGLEVSQGQHIGYVGTTGRSTGPHLHFEIHERGVPIDPLPLLGEGGPPADATGEEAAEAHDRVLSAVGVGAFIGPYRLRSRGTDVPELHEALVIRGFSVRDYAELSAAEDTTAFVSSLDPGAASDAMSSLRPYGSAAFAQAEFYSSEHDVTLTTPDWHARLARFRLSDATVDIGAECAARVGTSECGSIQSTANRFAPAVTQ
jgi:murein DD-endopeptidase MepM/ murein hydrolase activator NlpD